MIYRTSYCPHCKKIIKEDTNPSKQLGIPFDSCTFCGKTYIKSDTEEWITKSPLKRHLYFLQYGTWARAFILPMLFFSILLSLIDMEMDPFLFWIIWQCISIAYIIVAYFFYKKRFTEDIELSLQRTTDKDYLDLLKQAGYKIYPVDNLPPLSNKAENNDDETNN